MAISSHVEWHRHNIFYLQKWANRVDGHRFQRDQDQEMVVPTFG